MTEHTAHEPSDNYTGLRRVQSRVSRSPLASQAARSAWAVTQRTVRASKKKRYLASTDDVRLMLGAGPNRRPGWLATDIMPSRSDVMYLDVTRRFPFTSDSVDLIHTEHVIQAVTYEGGQTMIRECARVLRPGGRLRISTPDFDRVIALAGPDLPQDVLALMRDANAAKGVPPDRQDDPCFAVNRLFSDYGHRFLYTERLLTRCLLEGGFRDVSRCAVGESDHPGLRGVDMHGERIAPAWNDYQSLILEAAV